MRVAPDARSYARTVAAGKPHEEQIAKAFHDGMLHERANEEAREPRGDERADAADRWRLVTNEPEKPPIDAVRAKIAEMRASAMDIRRAQRHVAAALLDDAANALEAVLDVEEFEVSGSGEFAVWSSTLEAALTRAITKGEQ